MRCTLLPIHLDLKELALRGGERYERTYPLEMAPIVLGGQSYEVLVPNGVNVAVDRVAGGYLGVGVARGIPLWSVRALPAGGHSARQATEQEFAPTAKDGWEETDLSPFIEEFVVDVSGLAREATVLALPSQVVCAQECPGLCPVCGNDLKAGACGCPQDGSDERWSALRGITFEE